MKEHLKQEVVVASPNKAPLGFEIALVTPDVPALYARALKAGATVVSEPSGIRTASSLSYAHLCHERSRTRALQRSAAMLLRPARAGNLDAPFTLHLARQQGRGNSGIYHGNPVHYRNIWIRRLN